MSHVRQFHIDGTAIQGDKPVPLRQVGADQAFYLGYFNPKQKASGKSGKQQTDVTEHRDNSVSKTTMRHIGDQRYLTQYWEGGTVCDLTGKPRSIEIQASKSCRKMYAYAISAEQRPFSSIVIDKCMIAYQCFRRWLRVNTRWLSRRQDYVERCFWLPKRNRPPTKFNVTL